MQVKSHLFNALMQVLEGKILVEGIVSQLCVSLSSTQSYGDIGVHFPASWKMESSCGGGRGRTLSCNVPAEVLAATS